MCLDVCFIYGIYTSLALYLSVTINKYHKSFTLTGPQVSCFVHHLHWQYLWCLFIVIELLGYVNMKA